VKALDKPMMNKTCNTSGACFTESLLEVTLLSAFVSITFTDKRDLK